MCPKYSVAKDQVQKIKFDSPVYVSWQISHVMFFCCKLVHHVSILYEPLTVLIFLWVPFQTNL